MITKIIDGGWYGECLPDGEYAVTVGHAVQTHMGTVQMDDPADQLLFTRCSVASGFKIAGQSHNDRGTLLNTGTGWRVAGGSCGTSPVLFTPSGELIFSANCEYGSQGLRYFDTEINRPVSGDDTYDQTRGRSAEFGITNLWEWTKQGDITIGQGRNGATALYNGRRIQLMYQSGNEILPVIGDSRWIRFTRNGDTLAVTIVRQPENRTILLWLTKNDLLTFPDEMVPPPVVIVPPPVIIPPTPSNPTVSLDPTVKDIIGRFVARFPVPQGPTPSDDPFENLCRDYMQAMAEQIVFETGDESYGNKNAGGGRPRSKDSIARQEQRRLINFDMLTGVGTGRPRLVTDPQGEDITGQVFMPVEGKNHLGTVVPPVVQPPVVTPPVVVPQPYDDSSLRARLSTLEAALNNIEDNIKTLDRKIDGLIQRIADAKIAINVGRTYGHSHPASGKLEF